MQGSSQVLAHLGNLGSSNPGWNFYIASDGSLTVRATSNNAEIHAATAAITGDEWHHVAMVIDNENGTLSTYLDGQSSDATESVWTAVYDGLTFTPGTEFTTNDSIIVGERWNASTGTSDIPFEGMMDDFAIWNRALSETEIFDIFGGATIIPDQIAGDANGDGKVDGSDVTILANNWQHGVGMTEPDATWGMGDFNGDGKVDGSDVTILANNWQYGVTAEAASVPEPGTLLLLLSTLLTSAFLFKRH